MENIEAVAHQTNPSTITINFIDDDNPKHPLILSSSSTFSNDGEFDRTVVLTFIKQFEDQGYQLTAVADFPKTYPATDTTYEVHFKHRTVLIDPRDPNELPGGNEGTLIHADRPQGPKYPAGLAAEDLTKTITRTIEFQAPKRADLKPVEQAITFFRTAQLDEISQDVTYQPWTRKGNRQWPSLAVPKVNGYQAHPKTIKAVSGLTAEQPNETVTVAYEPKTINVSVRLIDDVTDQAIWIESMPHQVDQPVQKSAIENLISRFESRGFKLVAQPNLPKAYPTHDVDYAIHFTHRSKIIDPTETHMKQLADDPNAQDITKTVTRTIMFERPDQTQPETLTQTINFKRPVTLDQVDQSVQYGDWQAVDTADFDEVTSPKIKGYLAQPSKVKVQTKVKANTANELIKVEYRPAPASITVNFIDDTKHDKMWIDGKMGHFNDTFDHTPVMRMVKRMENNGYQLVDEVALPKTYPVRAGTYNVHFTHEIKTITAVDTREVDGHELIKPITRTLIYHNPDGTENKVEQRVELTRKATKDLVSGKLKFSDWQVPANHQWPKTQSPEIKGYQPDIVGVPEVDISTFATDQTVDVHYEIKEIALTIQLVDEIQDRLLASFVLNGQFEDETDLTEVKDKIKTLTNTSYELAAPLDLPTHFEDLKEPVVIKFKHVKAPVDQAEAVDRGISPEALTRQITRQINFIDENGNNLQPTVMQTVTFNRQALMDQVTGALNGFTDWQSEDDPQFEQVAAPKIDGFKTESEGVPALTVNPNQDDVNTTVHYQSDTITSETNETQVPSSSEPETGDDLPANTDSETSTSDETDLPIEQPVEIPVSAESNGISDTDELSDSDETNLTDTSASNESLDAEQTMSETDEVADDLSMKASSSAETTSDSNQDETSDLKVSENSESNHLGETSAFKEILNQAPGIDADINTPDETSTDTEQLEDTSIPSVDMTNDMDTESDQLIENEALKNQKSIVEPLAKDHEDDLPDQALETSTDTDENATSSSGAQISADNLDNNEPEAEQEVDPKQAAKKAKRMKNTLLVAGASLLVITGIALLDHFTTDDAPDESETETDEN